MSDRRGLVVSSPVTIGHGGGFSARGGLDPQELRFSLLFWDTLDFPTNNIFTSGSGPDETFLEQAGVMSRSHTRIEMVSFSSGDVGRLHLDCHLATFRRLDQAEPGIWSLATGERSLSFPDADLEQGRGALVAVHRAIPIPDKDVALQDILEFRQRRRPELPGLRSHLEGVYLRVQSAGDGPIAWNKEISDLDRALRDHLRTSREWGVQLKWAGLEAGLNLPAGVGVAAFAMSQGAPLLGAAASGLAASIVLKGGPALRQREISRTPFRYVSKFHDEVFL